jgi:hypothetical protein
MAVLAFKPRGARELRSRQFGRPSVEQLLALNVDAIRRRANAAAGNDGAPQPLTEALRTGTIADEIWELMCRGELPAADCLVGLLAMPAQERWRVVVAVSRLERIAT